MPDAPLDTVYQAALAGRLDRYLDRHPEFVTDSMADALADDFHKAVDFGDLAAAAVAASAAVAVCRRLNLPERALELDLERLRIELDTSGTESELATLRAQTMEHAAALDADGSRHQALRYWLVAADASFRAARMTSQPERGRRLMAVLRDLSDIAEALSEMRVSERHRSAVVELAILLASTAPSVRDMATEGAEVLPTRAVLRRVARASERVLHKGLADEIYTDPGAARELEARLVRLFTAEI